MAEENRYDIRETLLPLCGISADVREGRIAPPLLNPSHKFRRERTRISGCFPTRSLLALEYSQDGVGYSHADNDRKDKPEHH